MIGVRRRGALRAGNSYPRCSVSRGRCGFSTKEDRDGKEKAVAPQKEKQPLLQNGGADGIRTRDLRRDRPAF